MTVSKVSLLSINFKQTLNRRRSCKTAWYYYYTDKKSEKGLKESWLSKASKPSFWDPRNSYMWTETEGDKLHILVLFFLYILQGIPLGLRTSVPLVLEERGVSYNDQFRFSFASYPFSMKILWAPIVDAIFIKKFGRRKSWLIPTQMLIGGFILKRKIIRGLQCIRF